MANTVLKAKNRSRDNLFIFARIWVQNYKNHGSFAVALTELDYFSTEIVFLSEIIHTFAMKYEFSYKSIVMLEDKGKYIFGVVKVGERGQIVIPKEAREVYGIKAGDSLLVLGDKKGMAVVKTEIFQDKIDEMLGEA